MPDLRPICINSLVKGLFQHTHGYINKKTSAFMAWFCVDGATFLSINGCVMKALILASPFIKSCLKMLTFTNKCRIYALKKK